MPKKTCGRKIFAEQFPELTRPHVQHSLHLQETLRQIVLVLGATLLLIVTYIVQWSYAAVSSGPLFVTLHCKGHFFWSAAKLQIHKLQGKLGIQSALREGQAGWIMAGKLPPAGSSA